MLIPKTTYIRNEKHRRFIASLPCLICSSEDVQAAHIRRGNSCGVGLKPCDSLTVPLCIRCHAKQHEVGELVFYKDYAGYEAASALARRIYKITSNREAALRLIAEWRR